MEYITVIVSFITLIVFFVMASNIGKCVVFLREIYHILKEANDPIKQRAKNFDAEEKLRG